MHDHFLRLKARQLSKQDNTAQKDARKLPYREKNLNQQKSGRGLNTQGKKHCVSSHFCTQI